MAPEPNTTTLVDDHLTAAETAALLKWSRSALDNRVALGQAPGPVIKLNSRFQRWSRSELQAWVAAGMPPMKEWRATQKKR